MSNHWEPSATPETLKARAEVLRTIREWFFERGILEVETPLLVCGATTDPHIDSFQTSGRTLRTSSEFHQKRLLAADVGDNYELGKVFRVDECGRYHNPEFTMLEWYRCGIDHHALIDEVAQLLAELHGEDFPGFLKISYRDLWLKAASVDINDTTLAAVADCFDRRGIAIPNETRDRWDDLLDFGMGTFVVEQLPADTYTCVYHYPASQASLARIQGDDTDYPYACRFEIFYGKVELANGYYELTVAEEQQARFESDNRERIASGKSPMPVDGRLISALAHGLPECAGVAVGVDRLMMVLLKDIDHIGKTLSFEWERA